MTHLHSVVDTDTRFIIDPVTRQIKNGGHRKPTLIQNDHMSEVYTFECPKTIEGHDMSQCTDVEIHFLNVGRNGVSKSGFYTAKDFKVDGENVVCTWPIDHNATGLVGSLNFLVVFKCKEDDHITYAWHTDVFREIRIAEGINADERFENDYVDVIDRWKDSVMNHFTAELAAWKARTVNEVKEEISERIDLLSNYVTPEMFGAKGDGVTDDTDAIQTALNVGKKVIFGHHKTYLVNCAIGSVALNVNSNTTIDFNYSTIKLTPTNKGIYHIVNLSEDNCTIMNGILVGDKNEHTGTDEEHGQCVTIRGKNIELINMTMMRGWGDGVFIGKRTDEEPENVRMYNCKCLENRRNGMSIVAGKNIYIDNCAFNYTTGAAPQSGFDIEPNEDDEISVFMDNIECVGNGNSPFCLSNRHSTNCRVLIGKIFTDGSVVYIRSPEKSFFHINDLYHVSKSASGLHLVGGLNTHIEIDNLTIDMCNETCLRAIYTEGIYDCTIGNLTILGDKADFISNADNCNINIGRLTYNPIATGVSLSKTNINIDSVAPKSEVITASNKQPKMFANKITFDGTESTTMTIFCRNYPNEFTLKAYNPTSVAHDIYCDDGKITNGTTESSRMTLEPNKMVELKYYKTAGRWVVVHLF